MKDTFETNAAILAANCEDHRGAITGQSWEVDANVAAATQAMLDGNFPVISPSVPGEEIVIRR